MSETLPVSVSTVENAINALGGDATIEQIADGEELPQSGIDAIEVRVTRAIENPSTDLICDLLDRFAFMKRRIKELEAKFKPILAAHVKTNGPIEIGDNRWSYAPDKDTDSIDHPTTLMALLEHFQGDVTKVCDAFSAHPFKHGWCRETLPPETYEACFKTTVTDDVKVKKFNKAFVKHKHSAPANSL